MVRHGKYTHRPGLIGRITHSAKRKWQWFSGLSKKQKALLIGLPVFAFMILTPLVTYAVMARDISDPERLMNRNNTGVELMDKNGEVFYSTNTSTPLKRVPLAQISDHLEKAVISSEDKNFYDHAGVSVRAMIGAIYGNIVSSDATAYGGSTLTQQLVKNTLLTSDKNFLRKYQELFLAIAVERQYTKDEILDMYINSVHYGEGAFGIDEAAKTYFDKTAADLTLAESSMLVGLLPAPSAYSPINGDPELAKKQQSRVLGRMVEDGKITEAEKKEAESVDLAYASPSDATVGSAPHFAEMVISELNDRYGEETVRRSGYRVKTTLDLGWQKQAQQIVADQTAINARQGGRNAALVAIDPRSGEIRALVGSADYNEPTFGKVNMAIAARQPGSSFKPIYFTEALAQRKVTPATIMKDEAKTYGEYAPQNFDFRFRGDITVRNALAQSLNIPAVDVMQKVGVDQAVKTAQRMGIASVKKDADYGLSLALGAAEAKPLEMTNAYAAFANGGEQYEATMISAIQNKFGNTIYTYRPKASQVQSAQATFLISDILSDNTARAPTFGSSLNVPGRDVAVKTGSTDDNRDAWTIGYTPSLVVGVWVGNNENEVMQSGGSAFAGPIWRKSMQAFLANTPAESFEKPSGISEVSICRSNGLRATGGASEGVYKEFFISGTVPTESCNAPRQNTEQDNEERDEEEVTDSDGDGVADERDRCANTPRGTEVDNNGCPKEDEEQGLIDSDLDGVADSRDRCVGTPLGTQVDGNGCPQQQNNTSADADKDGVADSRDLCPGTPTGTQVDSTGCPASPAPTQTQGTSEEPTSSPLPRRRTE